MPAAIPFKSSTMPAKEEHKKSSTGRKKSPGKSIGTESERYSEDFDEIKSEIEIEDESD
jgi:uncharacterized protein YacL (UPF0231 family)